MDLAVSVALIAFGAYAVLFNRSFSQTVVRQQKAMWKVDLSRYGTAFRILSTVVGIGLLGFGIWGAARILMS